MRRIILSCAALCLAVSCPLPASGQEKSDRLETLAKAVFRARAFVCAGDFQPNDTAKGELEGLEVLLAGPDSSCCPKLATLLRFYSGLCRFVRGDHENGSAVMGSAEIEHVNAWEHAYIRYQQENFNNDDHASLKDQILSELAGALPCSHFVGERDHYRSHRKLGPPEARRSSFHLPAIPGLGAHQLLEIGKAYEDMGLVDDAIWAYENALGDTADYNLGLEARVHKRLSGVWVTKGDYELSACHLFMAMVASSGEEDTEWLTSCGEELTAPLAEQLRKLIESPPAPAAVVSERPDKDKLLMMVDYYRRGHILDRAIRELRRIRESFGDDTSKRERAVCVQYALAVHVHYELRGPGCFVMGERVHQEDVDSLARKAGYSSMEELLDHELYRTSYWREKNEEDLRRKREEESAKAAKTGAKSEVDAGQPEEAVPGSSDAGSGAVDSATSPIPTARAPSHAWFIAAAVVLLAGLALVAAWKLVKGAVSLLLT